MAGRSLGPGLLFATFLAANIGASSTVGATGYAYRDGLAAWWWNGSAGLGTLVLAFWLGPRMWRQAMAHDFLTVGDFLEHHFGRDVRGLAALSIWLGSFLILCGQLLGAALVLQRATGVSLGTGAFLAAVAVVGYFVVGGLKSAAWVNRVQLVVIVGGFAIAAPLASHTAGGWFVSGAESSFWFGKGVGWQSLLLLAPAFFLSPGLAAEGLRRAQPGSPDAGRRVERRRADGVRVAAGDAGHGRAPTASGPRDRRNGAARGSGGERAGHRGLVRAGGRAVGRTEFGRRGAVHAGHVRRPRLLPRLPAAVRQRRRRAERRARARRPRAARWASA